MARLALAPNVPVGFDVRYCDIVPGQYGPQVRFKGKADGADAIYYVDVEPGLAALRDAGALGQVPDYGDLPEKGVELRLKAKQLVFRLDQAAGQKRGTLNVSVRGGGSTGAPSPAPSPSGPRAPAGEAGATPAERPKLSQMYLECVDVIVDKVVPKLTEKDIGVSAEAVASMVATLFIARTEGR